MEYDIKTEVGIAISFSISSKTRFNDMILLLLMTGNDENKDIQFRNRAFSNNLEGTAS